MNTVRIELLGTSFSVQTDESREYFMEVLDAYKRKVELVQSQTQSADTLKTAILAGILIQDDALTLRRSMPSQARPFPAGATSGGKAGTPPAARAEAAPVAPASAGQGGGDESNEAEIIALRLISSIDEKLSSL